MIETRGLARFTDPTSLGLSYAASRAVHSACQRQSNLKISRHRYLTQPQLCLGNRDQASAAGLDDVFPEQHGECELPILVSGNVKC